jgi:hypothetical protein
MSEPTSGGNEKPGSEPEKDAERGPQGNPDDVQDQPSESVFNDPTAPVWADPTAPLPTPPTPPGATHPQSDQPEADPLQTPTVGPPPGNPYAQQPQPQGQQQPPPAPYGQQQPGQQYPAYGQQYPASGQQYPAYGQQYPAYGQQTYATGTQTETNTSAIVLTVLSGISFFVGNILAIGSLILGIVALTRNTTDHDGSLRMTKIGWIVFAVTWAVAILVGLALIIVFAVALSHGDSNTTFGN